MKIFFILILFTSCFSAVAQYDVEKAEKDTLTNVKKDKVISAIKKNTYVGSGFNILLGNQLYLYATPQIGYEFLPNFSGGLLSVLQYYTASNGSQTYRESAVGGGIFTRYLLIDRIVFESSFNLYKIKSSITGQIVPNQYNAKSWMVGLGLANKLGDRSYANFLISYDLLRDYNNPENLILNLNNFKLYYKFGIVIYPFSQ